MKKMLLIATTLFTVFFANAQCWKTIAAGKDHSLGIKNDGTLWVWGDNYYHQLGLGDNINYPSDRTLPVQLGIATNWQTIASSEKHSVSLKNDGTLWTWGNNVYGQLGDGTNVKKSIPVQIGTATWQKIAANISNTAAIKSDGTLWIWGDNNFGVLGDGTNVSKNIPTQTGTATWQSVALGSSHTLGIKSDGTLWGWGSNAFGQLAMGTNYGPNIPTQIGTATWQSVAANNYHTIAIKSDGTLWTCGNNFNGQLGDGTTVNKNVLTQIGTASDWQSISTGAGGHALATKTDGTLWTWGENQAGQLGDNTRIDILIPTQLGTDTNWKSIAAGGTHTLALKTNDELWAWGNDNNGQMGNGNVIQSDLLIPSAIACPTSALGLKEIRIENEFNIFPNPSSGNFNIEVDQDLMGAKATIYNLLGQKVKDFSLNSTTTNQTLNKGVYLIEIEKDGNKTTKKLIVN
ncbi:T9SS type A sorting domain-containing protein [Flavobacterium alvei]|mgnify:FL=1|uniref:T9SS type A sorting domain-containing protein n=1 Tax=Flavobacterium alvei TaxID=2080416 RepID=UPI0026EB0047|nr:T9SS type A sorting domain-containing protein [Flavobacterium alvei]